MRALSITRDHLRELVSELASRYQVIAPRDDLTYGAITSLEEVHLGDGKPARPLKDLFFAQRQNLFEYHVQSTATPAHEVELTSPKVNDASRVIFGARPCDVAALTILDRVFAWDYLDSFYLVQRQNTTIIALGCDKPCATCFCTSVGGSPTGSEGAELLLTPLGKDYHVQVTGERGEALVAEYSRFFEASSKELDKERAYREAQWREQIAEVDINGSVESLDFDSPVWQTLARQCIDCGICTFLCPTCHCFDIQDEGSPTDGARVRLWDSCAFRNFTKTSVHEPRATHYSRYRQRIMHKFKYYPQNFDRILCVGCGRCIQHCPVGIDIRQVLERVKD